MRNAGLLALLAALTSCGCGAPPREQARCVADVTLPAPLQPLHPLRTFAGSSAALVDLVYDPVLPGPGRPRSVANLVEEADDHLVLRVKRAVFHDGAPVRAADVAASINSSAGNTGLTAIAESEGTVRVTCAQPCPALSSSLRRVSVTTASAAAGEESWDPPPGCGPFRIEAIDERSAKLVRWEQGPGPAPALPRLTVSAATSFRAAWARAMTDATDFVLEGPEAVLRFLGQLPDWSVQRSGVSQSYMVAVSARARTAGLGRWLRSMLPGVSSPSDCLPCSGGGRELGLCPLWSEQPPAPAFATPLPLRLLYWTSDERSGEAALRLQQRFDEASVRLALEPLASTELFRRVSAGDYDLLIGPTPIDDVREYGLMLGSSVGHSLGFPPAVAEALARAESPHAAQAAWASQDAVLLWFVAPAYQAVREPYAGMGPIARPAILTVLGWRPPEGCPP